MPQLKLACPGNATGQPLQARVALTECPGPSATGDGLRVVDDRLVEWDRVVRIEAGEKKDPERFAFSADTLIQFFLDEYGKLLFAIGAPSRHLFSRERD